MSVYGRLLLQRTDLLSAVKVHTEECIVKSQTAVKQKNNIEFLTVRNLGSAVLLWGFFSCFGADCLVRVSLLCTSTSLHRSAGTVILQPVE